jgi:hypothetical protein
VGGGGGMTVKEHHPCILKEIKALRWIVRRSTSDTYLTALLQVFLIVVVKGCCMTITVTMN